MMRGMITDAENFAQRQFLSVSGLPQKFLLLTQLSTVDARSKKRNKILLWLNALHSV